MRFEVVPIQCRLSKTSLKEAVQYANIGTKYTPAGFRLRGRHQLKKCLSIEDLFEYVHEEMAPQTIVIISRDLSYEYPNSYILGLADSELQVGMARPDPEYRGKLRNEDLAQTMIHEGLHLTGKNHHTRQVYTRDGLLCPFMHFSQPRKTDLHPCEKCREGLIHFCETRAA